MSNHRTITIKKRFLIELGRLLRLIYSFNYVQPRYLIYISTEIKPIYRQLLSVYLFLRKTVAVNLKGKRFK